MLLLLLLLGCAHVTAISTGPAPGEFYAVVERYNPLVFPISLPQGYVLRCVAAPGARTTCERVLSAAEAAVLAPERGYEGEVEFK